MKYSKTEIVEDLAQIDHRYFKVILKKMGITGVEITSTADVPAGTGLGSSSSFTVGLLHSLYSYRGKFVSKERLALEACRIEIDELGQPIGKQDQYAAAFGGLNFYTFNQDGSVYVDPVIMPGESCKILENSLMMFYVGGTHSASEILREQGKNILLREKEESQLKLCALTRDLKRELQFGRVDRMGEILDVSWELKKTLADGISNPLIDGYYESAKKAGALGGKLLGAGGGGFLLLYVPAASQRSVRERMNIPELPFRFDRQGSAVIYVGQKPHTIQMQEEKI